MAEWLRLDATQHFFNEIRERIDDKIFALTSGETLKGEDVTKDTARAVGIIEGLSMFLLLGEDEDE